LKYNKLIFYISVGIFFVIVADVYLLKPINNSDKIDSFYNVTSYTRLNGAGWATTILYTKSGLKLPLPENHSYDFPDTSTLIIQRGFIFNKPVSIRIISNGEAYQFPVNELNRTNGGKVVIAVILILFLVVAFQIFFKRTINDRALLLASIVTFYLLADFLFNISSLLIS
jgi:hypothetical protein